MGNTTQFPTAKAALTTPDILSQLELDTEKAAAASRILFELTRQANVMLEEDEQMRAALVWLSGEAMDGAKATREKAHELLEALS